MAKVYLFMIVCLYQPDLSLQETCKIFPKPEPYETIWQCLDAGEAIRKTLRETNENVYPTSFCSEKNINFY